MKLIMTMKQIIVLFDAADNNELKNNLDCYCLCFRLNLIFFKKNWLVTGLFL